MGAPCVKCHFKQGCLPVNGPLSMAKDSERSPTWFVIERKSKGSPNGQMGSRNPRMVDFLDFQPPALKRRCRFCCFCNEDRATRPVVKPVEHVQRVMLAKRFGQLVCQSGFASTMRGHSCRFDDHQKVVILEGNFQGDDLMMRGRQD